MIQDSDMMDVATADHSGGSLNSLNGAIYVKSCERAMCHVQQSSQTARMYVNKHKHNVTILAEKIVLIRG